MKLSTRGSILLPALLGFTALISCDAKKEAKAPALAPTKAATPTPKEKKVQAPVGKGTVRGQIKFTGTPPKPEKIDMSILKDCAKANPDPKVAYVRVSNGGLADVFVHIKEGLPKGVKYPVPETSVKLDQKGCLYHPLVLGLQTQQTLEIINSDHFMHNVNAQAKRGAFNVAMVKPGKVEKRFKKPEVMVPIQCNVHPWMKAWVGVVAHPFFSISDDQGAFEIPEAPAGTYTLEFWHSKLGTQTKSVTVSPDQTTEVALAYETGS